MAFLEQRKMARILFDEYHSESWTISEAHAREMQMANPANSSYEKAATELLRRDFILKRNIDLPLEKDQLETIDVLVIIHPCEPKWEKTTSENSPRLSSQEIHVIQGFVQAGGGLIVVTEYENEKYGNNLNDLLAPFGVQIENTTVSDRTSFLNVPTWVLVERAFNDESNLFYGVEKACFYRAASCTASIGACIAVRASSRAHPSKAGFIATAKYGAGRVVAITDSDIFGDEHINDFDHLRLWLNIAYWVSAPAFIRGSSSELASRTVGNKTWPKLKSAVNQLRRCQEADGSINLTTHSRSQVELLVAAITSSLDELRECFPHQIEYFDQLKGDLQEWVNSGLLKPDFGNSLAAFNPQALRENGIEHLVIFPMYTPNASSDIRFEALIIRIPWPDWLAHLENTRYPNPKFVPGNLVAYTEGYDSECAVLFPETVSLNGNATNNFGIIFCDREAKRYQAYVSAACKILQMDLPPHLECYLGSLELIQDTYALWDLIHDQAHSRGPLPFDPFIFRKKLPYWMYALEELRVDLASFYNAVQLSKREFPFARYILYAILFDRIFRFAITGTRVKNYDALGGQLLFSFLHKKGILRYQDNQLSVRWEELADAVDELRLKLQALYEDGLDMGKLAYWISAYDLISEYVKPNLASKWKKDTRAISDETDPKAWLALILDDEFPLGQFHLNLKSKIERQMKTS